MRIGSCFSGVGGLDLAVERVFGAETAWFCELDDAPAKVLAYRWPGVPNLRDISSVDWATVPPVGVYTAGFPCTDVSAAGRRAGLKHGTRTGLWHEAMKGIAALQPEWVVLENVLGLFSADGDEDDGSGRPIPRAIATVLADLARVGRYSVRWVVVRASDVGAPHHRARVFIVATRNPWPVPAGARPVAQLDGDLWVEMEDSLFGTVPFTDRWPHAGTVVDGVAYVVDTERAMAAGELLPTPTVGNATGTNERRGGERGGELLLPGVAVAAAAGDLLPTPTASDADKARDNPAQAARNSPPLSAVSAHFPTPRASRGGSATETMYALGGHRDDTHRPQGEVVLPTPTASERGDCPSERARRTPDLIAVQHYFPTPNASDGSGGAQSLEKRQGHSRQIINLAYADAIEWGKYQPAIDRWTHVLGRAAPPPTEPNSNNRPRLNAAFAQWMMGWPAGWVTDPAIGLTRAQQLKAIGNGVVDLQAEHGIRTVLAWQSEAVAA